MPDLQTQFDNYFKDKTDFRHTVAAYNFHATFPELNTNPHAYSDNDFKAWFKRLIPTLKALQFIKENQIILRDLSTYRSLPLHLSSRQHAGLLTLHGSIMPPEKAFKEGIQPRDPFYLETSHYLLKSQHGRQKYVSEWASKYNYAPYKDPIDDGYLCHPGANKGFLSTTLSLPTAAFYATRYFVQKPEHQTESIQIADGAPPLHLQTPDKLKQVIAGCEQSSGDAIVGYILGLTH